VRDIVFLGITHVAPHPQQTPQPQQRATQPPTNSALHTLPLTPTPPMIIPSAYLRMPIP
jgi:hypothetical protein